MESAPRAACRLGVLTLRLSVDGMTMTTWRLGSLCLGYLDALAAVTARSTPRALSWTPAAGLAVADDVERQSFVRTADLPSEQRRILSAASAGLSALFRAYSEQALAMYPDLHPDVVLVHFDRESETLGCIAETDGVVTILCREVLT